jgi:hypothetical protein
LSTVIKSIFILDKNVQLFYLHLVNHKCSFLVIRVPNRVQCSFRSKWTCINYWFVIGYNNQLTHICIIDFSQTLTYCNLFLFWLIWLHSKLLACYFKKKMKLMCAFFLKKKLHNNFKYLFILIWLVKGINQLF